MGLLKLEDYMPAALANSLKADEEDRKRRGSQVRPQDTRQVEEEEVVTHTATEMNLRQGRQACVAPSEIWLSYLGVPRERLPVGNEQRGLAHDAEVRHSGPRLHRFRAVVSAVRSRRAL